MASTMSIIKSDIGIGIKALSTCPPAPDPPTPSSSKVIITCPPLGIINNPTNPPSPTSTSKGARPFPTLPLTLPKDTLPTPPASPNADARTSYRLEHQHAMAVGPGQEWDPRRVDQQDTLKRAIMGVLSCEAKYETAMINQDTTLFGQTLSHVILVAQKQAGLVSPPTSPSNGTRAIHSPWKEE